MTGFDAEDQYLRNLVWMQFGDPSKEIRNFRLHGLEHEEKLRFIL